jgi:ribonuclease P protein component
MSRLTLPKSRRLASNRQFKAVMDQRCRMSDRVLTVCVAPNSCGYARLGVSVGRTCGDAVVRNRLKRLMREAFRLSQSEIPRSFDYVLMVAPATVRRLRAVDSPAAASALLSCSQVRTSFLTLAQAACERAQSGRSDSPGRSRESSKADEPNQKGG